MKNQNTKIIITHLEYLGYTIEDLSGENEFDFLLATSEENSNILVRINTNNLMILSTRFSLNDSNSIVTPEFLKALNEENSKSVFTKAYYYENDEKKILLVIETFLREYDKKTFAATINAIEGDAVKYLQALRPYYVPESK